MSSHVFIFWIRFINIDISEIDKEIKTTPISTSMLRIDDLELLYINCLKVYDPKTRKYDAKDDKWKRFDSIMKEMSSELAFNQFDDFDPSVEKPLIPTNKYNRTLSKHFSQLCGVTPSLLPQPNEFFMLFL